MLCDEVLVDGKTLLVSGMPGREVDRYYLIESTPLEGVIALKGKLRNNLVLFGVFSLALSLIVGFMLAGQFLRPIGDLSEGVRAIQEGRFQHRIGLTMTDELGQLSTSFNSTMERLEELSVAHTVQESLFPVGALVHGCWEVYGRSVTATELGGDYYDYFALDDTYLIVLIGDVAGHGTASALLMAMAKALITVETKKDPHPVQVMEAINSMIFSAMRKKRMMTFFYGLLNINTGEMIYSNAGHNSPSC